MKYVGSIIAIVLFTLVSKHTPGVCITPQGCAGSVLAQTLRSDDVQLEIQNIELKTSTKTTQMPQASAEFLREGYILQTLAIDKTVSRPFTGSPQAYLLRAKPGIGLKLPLTISNYQSAAVLDLSVVPFNAQSSIDCKVVKVSACGALNWVSIGAEDEKIFMEVGKTKEVQLNVNVPEEAVEGDYYLSIRLNEHNKPYHYTSTELYLTITKDGIIQQNISAENMRLSSALVPGGSFLPTVVFGDQDQEVLIEVQNGSPVFGVADFDIKVRSPLGFERVIPAPIQVVLGNTASELSVGVEKLPFGPLTLSIHDNNKIPALSLPNPVISLSFLALLAFAIWSFMVVKKGR